MQLMPAGWFNLRESNLLSFAHSNEVDLIQLLIHCFVIINSNVPFSWSHVPFSRLACFTSCVPTINCTADDISHGSFIFITKKKTFARRGTRNLIFALIFRGNYRLPFDEFDSFCIDCHVLTSTIWQNARVILYSQSPAQTKTNHWNRQQMYNFCARDPDFNRKMANQSKAISI